MSENALQDLLDRELIKEVKARYFRCVDTKDWAGFRQVFTDDLQVDLMEGDPVEGADAFVETVRGMTTGARTVHHGHLPEVSFTSGTEAACTWVLQDYLEWEPDPETGERRGMLGYGHEHDTYRKVDGEWRIASIRLNYIRVDPLPREPLPDSVIGGPPILREGVYTDL